ncbi:nitrogen regulation protein NR(I) [uncultured Ferrimonas sp.]|uniref:nitrogen regulation protein NR(I) n=1 Tax=uncultured Ferrimonas sp. TaxID=432640 RepID=UPI0026287654|nr:nitrogen regulation protein NR(I) [uncultured Ferrimonas sp.]
MSEQVWILDDDSSIRWVLERALKRAEISSASFASADSLSEALLSAQPQAIISDIRMPGTDGLTLLQRIKQTQPELPVIIMTAHSDLDSAVGAYQAGAFEYLPKPFDIDEALTLIRRALEHSLARQPAKRVKQAPLPEIIGEAPAMQEVFRAIGRLARSSISVLINGQSGTGKELVASALHKHSPRAAHPFVALNMAAIPKDLIESELFGHEKGAFTGAGGQRTGRFEQANGGTLFLDEIGDMPLDVQTRLLRVLADGQFYRVGGHAPVKVDVRIVAATHQDLESRVKQGQFREDLFHRLNVIRVQLPPLCERSEDIPALALHFLRSAAKELGGEPKRISNDAMQVLQCFSWPGNVRQLENACRWMTVMASGQEILPQDLPPDIEVTSASPSASPHGNAPLPWTDELASWLESTLANGDSNVLKQALPAFERTMLTVALRHSGGHKQDAAKLLGWGRNTLTRKLKELDMDA